MIKEKLLFPAFAPPPIFFTSAVHMLTHLKNASDSTTDSSGGCQDTDFAAIAYALQSIQVRFLDFATKRNEN